MDSGGPYTTKIRYSDGRVETVKTPVEYETGTILSIVKKRDGSVVATLAE
jgi:hypothetical protein